MYEYDNYFSVQPLANKGMKIGIYKLVFEVVLSWTIAIVAMNMTVWFEKNYQVVLVA